MTNSLDRLRAALADRYVVDRELGSGATATVYLAQDLKHERQVALKVLSLELAAALGRDRFLQEIKIAANLHHPHILPLYDSGEADGFLFYVMPFAEGESLRDRLGREKQLAIDDALQIAREVADALSYAHGHGVIHRDVKPENILLESGHAVVADFGIARAINAAGGERLTETGIAIGTPTYMSPEQAAGEKELDGRSDLYALGCVLHEMLAGQPPFTGPTVESLVHQHLTAEPPSVTSIRPSVPGWVAAALERSLAKTPADRFNPVALFGEAIAPRVSVTDPSVRVAVSRKQRVLIPALFAVAFLVVIAVVLSRLLPSGHLMITATNIRQVTHEPGVEFQPALSPDGREVAFVVGPLGRTRIAVRSTSEIAGGGESRPAEQVSGLHWFPTWTTDGASLRLMACAPDVVWDGGGCPWREVEKFGGPGRGYDVPRNTSRYAWSRDGTRLAFVVGDSIYACSEGDCRPELLGLHTVNRWTPHSLAWSPDEQWIAYVNGNSYWRWGTNRAAASIWIISADGGEPIPVTDEASLSVSPQWLPDSRYLLFVSDRDGSRGVYAVEVGPDGPVGTPRSVPGVSDPHSITVSADGRKLAFARFAAAPQNIWSLPIPRSGTVSIRDAVPVTTGNQMIESHSLSPDEEWIAFDSDRRGEFDIYKQPLAGGPQQFVASIAGDAFAPNWSPDGAEIAFYGGGPIWVVPQDGGTPTEATTFGVHGDRPDWSPDGLKIAFNARGPRRDGPTNIWTVSRDSTGGPWSKPKQLTDLSHCGAADWAPDGASLVCHRGGLQWVRVSAEGQVVMRFDLSAEGLPQLASLHFSPDGLRLYFIATHDDGSSGVWWIPAEGGNATKVVDLDDPSRHPLAYLTVGTEHLYFTVAEYESDIWVMDLEW